MRRRLLSHWVLLHQVNFRRLEQANQLIKNQLHRISGRFDCVIGVPRSGALLASIIALQLNTRFALLDQLPHIDLRAGFLSRAAGGPESRLRTAALEQDQLVWNRFAMPNVR